MPPEAYKVIPDQNIKEVNELNLGDRVIVKLGEKIPVESMLT